MGILVEIPVTEKPVIVQNLKLEIVPETGTPVDVYGAIIDALTYEPMMEKDVYEAYSTKTSLYVPEILYLDPTEDARDFNVTTGKDAGVGRPIVCKSCNRCSQIPSN